jgi:flagellar assembly factor FliW
MSDFFTDLVYAKEDIITFQEGIPGFESSKHFVLVQDPEYTPFEWLVCTDECRLRFAVINPMLFEPEYAPPMHKEHLHEVGVEKAEDILLYAIVTIRENPRDCTANLCAPVLINRQKKLGKQIILEDSQYSVKEPILKDM